VSDDAPIDVTASAHPFAVVSYALAAAVSGNALKLYVILSRYADNNTGRAWPSRATLAEELGYKQARAVDPIIAELEAAGAITVTRSMKPGTREKDLNVYTVKRSHQIPAPSGSAQKRTTPQPEVVRKNAGGSAQKRTGVVRKNAHELIPNELITNELRTSAPADAETAQEPLAEVAHIKTPEEQLTEAAQYVARTLVERHPALKFPAMMTMAKRMMKAYAVDAGTVGRTMENIYTSGRGSITDQRVGQVLEGIVSAAGAAPLVDRKAEKMLNTLTGSLTGTPAGATAPALTADPFQLRITS
jgi:hypothetical protein